MRATNYFCAPYTTVSECKAYLNLNELNLFQVCVAALDLCPARMKLVNRCIRKLSEQFPNSIRVTMLEGLKLEYLKTYDEALAMYDILF